MNKKPVSLNSLKLRIRFSYTLNRYDDLDRWYRVYKNNGGKLTLKQIIGKNAKKYRKRKYKNL